MFSYVNFSNLQLIEELYQKWLHNPASVDPSWAHFFEGMQFAEKMPGSNLENASPDLRIYYLITAYRTYGHLMAKINPIATHEPEPARELDIENYGFNQADLELPFPTFGFLKEESAPLKDIIAALKKTYCSTIGIEYMGLGMPEMEKWLQEKIEPGFDHGLTKEEKLRILNELYKAEAFETFIHTKYVGQKRFSLEGAETLIPMINAMLDEGANIGISEAILGMAHRGRLNMLANIFGKSYSYIFNEFEDHYTPDLSEGTGDVKYHKGFAGKYQTASGKEILMTLAANPSHLESVDPVVEGGVRARQELKPKNQKKEVAAILIHGDAAVAGQGIIYETMQLSRLNGYSTEGTLHFVINNQIGFTTFPKDARSTRYCTDIAKTFSSPVFHVNAEDPEGCVAATKLALQLRHQFGCDVFIDLNGYRKYGHNESDEPAFTQPLEYALIRSKKTIREIYREQLISNNLIDATAADQLEEAFKNELKKAMDSVKAMQTESKERAAEAKIDIFKPVDTKVSSATLKELAQKIFSVPEGFNINPKIAKLFKEKLQAMETTLDWAMGELLAYATLCTEKVHVRLTGQDVRRGTFSHRHAMWVDQTNANKYFPLSHLSPNQAPCDVFNSPLSEYACLGFEFGYSLLYPRSLVIWEAQYGDFFNGAQIIIDQYISASEQKWGHHTNITLFLPHGYEGGGPEHSSARMERFLQQAAKDNMFIANCTDPAQFFHLLRRQAISPIKKPLIVFTPKVMRHPLCVSALKDLSSGGFQEIIGDTLVQKPKTVLLCSGKIYYDLFAEREKRKNSEIAIVRIEQLYPFHEQKLGALFDQYSGFKECIWVQEEHQNMGAWEFVAPIIGKILKGRAPLKYVGRDRSAATAAGSYALHKMQHAAIVKEIFG